MHQKPVKGILSANNGINLFRGCTHGCIYCDSRSDCYHMDHAFEDVLVKSNALELLEQSLMKKRKKCMIQTGSMSDPYISEELELRHTRKALAIIDRFGFGLAIQTKSDRILRDLDLLKSIHAKTKCVVELTLTTIDDDLKKVSQLSYGSVRSFPGSTIRKKTSEAFSMPVSKTMSRGSSGSVLV